MRKLNLIYNTVRHMTLRQWSYRIFYTLRNKLKHRTPIKVGNTEHLHRLNYVYGSNYSNNSNLDKANDILNNTFDTVSNFKVHFEKEIDWDLKEYDYRLMCFRLNSFKYLLYLSDAYELTKKQDYLDKGYALIDDWVDRNYDCIRGDKWNPYVIADRIMNWIGFLSVYCKDTDKLRMYSRLIYSQTLELKNSIEFQLGANHLLSEARALMYAGIFLNDMKIYSYGKKILLEEIKEQFLSDGGHYERSISYHIESLQQCFEAAILMKHIDDKEYSAIVKFMYKPFIFLNSMIMCDGNIPLVNDAACDYPVHVRDFINVSQCFGWHTVKGIKGDYSSRWNYDLTGECENLEIKSMFPTTGFYSMNYVKGKHEISFFFDVGDNGPDYNLGHTHADSLSILLSIDGKPILVDSGVFTYAMGKERDYCRSTKAHNTVEINNKSSAEVWSAFRVAKRGHTKLLDYYEDDTKALIKACHDGYSHILGKTAIHIREVFIDKKKLEIIIHDDFDTSGEDYKGIIRYHLYPNCSIKVKKINEVIINNNYKLCFSKPIYINNCNIASNFGVKKESKVICSNILINCENSYVTKFSLI